MSFIEIWLMLIAYVFGVSVVAAGVTYWSEPNNDGLGPLASVLIVICGLAIIAWGLDLCGV